MPPAQLHVQALVLANDRPVAFYVGLTDCPSSIRTGSNVLALGNNCQGARHRDARRRFGGPGWLDATGMPELLCAVAAPASCLGCTPAQRTTLSLGFGPWIVPRQQVKEAYSEGAHQYRVKAP